MKTLDVKIVELSPGRMLSFYGYGNQPEDTAWGNLDKWVKENKFVIDPGKNKIYGFNNPCPSAGSRNYGYEYLISVDLDFVPSGDARLVDFHGGLYAVAHFKVKSGEEIPAYWKELNLWCEKSNYSHGHHQWLEEHSPEGHPFAMYLPIKK